MSSPYDAESTIREQTIVDRVYDRRDEEGEALTAKLVRPTNGRSPLATTSSMTITPTTTNPLAASINIEDADEVLRRPITRTGTLRMPPR